MTGPSTDRPFFSVAMPVYNAGETLARAIESVLAQRFEDWELVITDDGSTDGTADVIRAYTERDGRIRSVRQANAGCGAARHSAVMASAGRYIVRLDADDALLPEYMERMHRFIEDRPGYDIYSCNGWHLYPDGTRRLARPGARYETEQSFTLEDMLSACHIFTIAVFSRDLFDRVGGVRPDVYCEDLDFWLRSLAIPGVRHRYLPEPLALYVVSDSQMTADVPRVLESRMAVYRDLVAAGTLTDEQTACANAAIERTRQDAWIYRRRTAVRTLAERLFGRKAGEAVSRAMHSLSGTLRPLAARVASAFGKKERSA